MSGLAVITGLLYLSAFATYLTSFSLRRRTIGTIAYRVTLVGLAVHTVGIMHRWQLAGRAPVANMHESMILFAWAVVVVGALLERGYRLGCFGPAVALTGLGLLGAGQLWDRAIHPLMPALNSPWLFWHVASCMLAYGALAIGWIASCLYLGVARRGRSETRLERLAAIDRTGHQAIVFGFTMLAIGIMSGSIWANLAWGSWWSWDPKETWALITWLTYAIYFHNRLVLRWPATKLAWFALCAFPCVLFTYLGVTYLLVGLHSYAG